jgi:hypothetical protein
VSRRDSCRLAGEKGDIMIATEPMPELGEMFDEFGGKGKPRIGQIAIAYDAERGRVVERAHDQFRWFGLGWRLNTDLPDPRRSRRPPRSLPASRAGSSGLAARTSRST